MKPIVRVHISLSLVLVWNALREAIEVRPFCDPPSEGWVTTAHIAQRTKLPPHHVNIRLRRLLQMGCIEQRKVFGGNFTRLLKSSLDTELATRIKNVSVTPSSPEAETVQ